MKQVFQDVSHSSSSIPHVKINKNPSINTYHHSRLSFGSQQFQIQQYSKPKNLNNLTQNTEINQRKILKGQNRFSYIPFQRKIIDYETKTIKQLVPKTKKIVQYKQTKIIQNIPRQVTKQDFIAIEKITQYYRTVTQQKQIQMIPIEKKVKTIQYIPVQKKIVYFPSEDKSIRQSILKSVKSLQSNLSSANLKLKSEHSTIKAQRSYKNLTKSHKNSQDKSKIDNKIEQNMQLPKVKDQLNKFDRFPNVIQGNKYFYRYGNINLNQAKDQYKNQRNPISKNIAQQKPIQSLH